MKCFQWSLKTVSIENSQRISLFELFLFHRFFFSENSILNANCDFDYFLISLQLQYEIPANDLSFFRFFDFSTEPEE